MGLQGDLRDQFGIERAPVSGSGKKFTPKFPNGFTIGSTTISSAELAELQTLVDSDLSTITATGGVVFSERITFTETAGSGTYTATAVLPAGALIWAIWPTGHVNWGAATSAAFSLGYTGSLTAYVNALDVKANDPATGGPYGLGDYFAGGTTITASCVTVDVAAGGAGRENLNVYYSIVTPVAATKA